jgi:hypothetical protein
MTRMTNNSDSSTLLASALSSDGSEASVVSSA